MCRVQEGNDTHLCLEILKPISVSGALLRQKMPESRLEATWRLLHQDAGEDPEEDRGQEGGKRCRRRSERRLRRKRLKRKENEMTVKSEEEEKEREIEEDMFNLQDVSL